MTLAWEDARLLAQEVLDNHWDGLLPVKVAGMCRNLGVKPYRATLPDDIMGMVIGEPNLMWDARAYVHAGLSADRRRFMLAHELGHYIERIVVADDDDFSFACRRLSNRDLHEYYADEFAYALLMPEREFTRMRKQRRSMTEMAATFGVPTAVVRERLECLGKPPRHIPTVTHPSGRRIQA